MGSSKISCCATQIDSVYDEFAGRTVVDLGCGTVSAHFTLFKPILLPSALESFHYVTSALLLWTILSEHADVQSSISCWPCLTQYSSRQGMLGIGAALLGSSHVIGVDIDNDALETAQANLDSFEDIQVSQPTSVIAELQCCLQRAMLLTDRRDSHA